MKQTPAQTKRDNCPSFMIMTISVAGLFSLLSCTTTATEKDVPAAQFSTIPTLEASLGQQAIPTAIKNLDGIFSLEDRMLLSSDIEDADSPTLPALGPLYSFRAHELPIIDALALFARSNQLNIVSGPEITGSATVDFHDLPLEQAMSALLEAHGYYWEHHDNLIQVRKFKTASLDVDYIRLVRGGTGQNRAQMSSGSSSGGGSSETGQIEVNQ
ncbi:MAG: hypothetical protein E4H32_06765, partial [Nitrospirales bacterium]